MTHLLDKIRKFLTYHHVNGISVYMGKHKIFSYHPHSLSPSKQWRKFNAHNETQNVNGFDIACASVGKGSYGPLNVEMNSDNNVKLRIGNYVSIGPEVRFILASEHPYRGFSTYPFKVKFDLQKWEAHSKGDIIVDDDVWIGLGAIICSGVHIGQGAIIAAGSVVVKDVEPYSIVGGNPAKLIKYRFEETIRKKLLQVDFSKLDRQTIIDNIDLVYTPLTAENIDEILPKITGGNK